MKQLTQEIDELAAAILMFRRHSPNFESKWVKGMKQDLKSKIAKRNKLMKSTESSRIILFESECEGTLLSNPKGRESVVDIGEYYDNWDMGCFEEYNEPVTIQND